MARASLTALIARVRALIADPAGASPVFSDDAIADALDGYRVEHRYLPLTGLESYAPGGVVSYLTWAAGVGDWESDAQVVDNDYNVLTPASVDYRAGRWSFVAEPSAVLASGWTHDIYAAAADLCEAWAAKLKLEYDFSADGLSVKKSQRVTTLLSMAAQLRGQSHTNTAVQVARMVRDDLTEVR